MAYFREKAQKLTFSNKIEISTLLLVFYNHLKKTKMSEQNQSPPPPPPPPSKRGTDGENEARNRLNNATNKPPIPFSLGDD